MQEAKAEVIRVRAEKVSKLRETFNEHVIDENRQAAGYSLEDILTQLFALFEIEFRKPYKTPTQQIDGHFNLDGFDYLVEARWRKGYATESDIAGFKQKVDSKLESTRGLFVSIMGFRPEVVDMYSKRGLNVIFMDGPDLIFILEGRMDLREALHLKVEKAAQEGRVFFPLGRA